MNFERIEEFESPGFPGQKFKFVFMDKEGTRWGISIAIATGDSSEEIAKLLHELAEKIRCHKDAYAKQEGNH